MSLDVQELHRKIEEHFSHVTKEQLEKDLKAAGLEEEDPLSAARGVFNGLLICLPFWILIAYLIWGREMATRNYLHISKLDDFKGWLQSKNFSYRSGKGDWEVLQVDTGKVWAKIYRRADMPEHFTVQDVLMPIVRAFMADKQKT